MASLFLAQPWVGPAAFFYGDIHHVHVHEDRGRPAALLGHAPSGHLDLLVPVQRLVRLGQRDRLDHGRELNVLAESQKRDIVFGVMVGVVRMRDDAAHLHGLLAAVLALDVVVAEDNVEAARGTAIDAMRCRQDPPKIFR